MTKFGKIICVMLLVLTACTKEFTYTETSEETKCVPTSRENADLRIAIMTRSGVKLCPNNRRCTGEALLPPQPCLQPMPTYYNDVSELAFNEGVLLIHPYTRAKVLCLDQEGLSAVSCAEMFRAEGYVLITDIPQFAGKYDVLKEGTYPTRRWRNGENVPRW